MRKEKWLTVKEIRDRVPRIATPITVYSPTREKRVMDGGSTALDYALATGRIHAGEIYVNGVKVEYGEELKTNDVVDPRDNEGVSPNPLWLLMVDNHESSAKIREFLRGLSFERRREVGIETLDQVVAKRFLKWKDIESTSQVREMLEYFSEKYEEKIEALAREGILDRFVLDGKKLTPLTLEVLAGIGEIDIEEVEEKFDEIYEASLERRKAEGETTAFAVLFITPQNRVGLQKAIEQDFEAIGFDIKKDGAKVNADDSATLAYVFNILSTVQQRQIENIVRRHEGEIEDSVRVRKAALEFNLTDWLKEHGIVI
jgi:hypothetical protein